MKELELNIKMRKVGAKEYPSFVIPVDKKLIDYKGFKTTQKVKVVISQ